MPTITETADDVFRDYATDGVPASGAHNPLKSQIRALFATIDDDMVDGLTFAGSYSSGTTYAVGAMVSYSGNSYVSRVGSNLNHTPDSSPTQWQLSAAQGPAAPSTLDIYVSATDGSDSGVGSYDDPFQTWKKGYDTVPAGATLWLFGTPEAPQTYYHAVSASTVVAKELTVRAINKGGAIVRSNGVTNLALSIAPTAGETVNLIGLVIDPSANGSASSLIYTLSLSSQATAYRLNCIDCTFSGWTGASLAYGVHNPSSAFKAYLSFERCTFVGDEVYSAIEITAWDEGELVVDGCEFTLTNQNLQSHGPIVAAASTAGVTATIDGNDISTTIKSSLTSTNQHYGIHTEGMVAKVRGNKVYILGPGSPRGSNAICVTNNGAGDATELAISGSIIEDNYCYCEPSGGGMGINFGPEATGDATKRVGCIMRRNTMRASVAAGAAGIHGLFVHYHTSAEVYDNDVDCGGINYVLKDSIGTLCHHNRSRGATSTAILHKGCTNGTTSDNEIILAPRGSGATAIGLTVNVGGVITVTTGVAVTKNVIRNEGAAGSIMVDIDATCSGTFTNNAWANLMGTLATNVFQNGATNYTTFAGWFGAVGTTDVANFS